MPAVTISEYVRRRVRRSLLLAIAGLVVPMVGLSALDRANPTVAAVLTAVGVLVFGFAYLRAMRTKCPRCRNGIFMLVMHIALPTTRARIRYCPFCGTDFDEPSEM